MSETKFNLVDKKFEMNNKGIKYIISTNLTASCTPTPILSNETPLSFRAVMHLGTNTDATTLIAETIETTVKTFSLVRVRPLINT